MINGTKIIADATNNQQQSRLHIFLHGNKHLQKLFSGLKNMTSRYIIGRKSSAKGIKRIIPKFYKQISQMLLVASYWPGHPKMLRPSKCLELYLRPQSQHHSYLHTPHVMWLQPEIFSIFTLHLGHLCAFLPAAQSA